jgi:hypothetical protein
LKKVFARLVRQSPAMIVAMIALFVAMTGTAVATSSALIGGAQIRNNSITGADIKNKSLRPIDFRGSVRGVRGLRGLAGPPGPVGPQGAQGAQGAQGPAGPITAAAPAGVTLRGNYAVSQTGSTNFAVDAFSFVLRLSAAPAVHYINVGAAAPPECPGTATDPQAAPGHLCVYEANATNTTSRGVVNAESPAGTLAQASREGAGIYMFPTNVNHAYIWGSWAVTSAGTSATAAGQQGQTQLVD